MNSAECLHRLNEQTSGETGELVSRVQQCVGGSTLDTVLNNTNITSRHKESAMHSQQTKIDLRHVNTLQDAGVYVLWKYIPYVESLKLLL